MEDIQQRLATLPLHRQKQFQTITEKELASCFSDGMSKETIIQETKEKILRFIHNEKAEKLSHRRHGSKGRKHRERGPEYIQKIKEKLDINGINYVLLFKELFDITLKEKQSNRGISYIGLCPIHREDTPSLSVSPHKRIIKCFGCGHGGSEMRFFNEALGTKFSETFGLLEKYINSPEEAKKWEEKNEIVKNLKAKTHEQQDKEAFIHSIPHERGYLPQKEFDQEFKRWKQLQHQVDEQVRKPRNGNYLWNEDPDGLLPF